MSQARPEFPNPQFERRQWTNLNGEWEFEIDTSKSGEGRKLFEAEHLSGRITVPFCPESRLSGVGNTDFLECVWYRRDIEIPEEYEDRCVILHFGAVDHIATVYVNGICVGSHTGGYVGFSFDITSYLKEGKNSLCVQAVDETRNPLYGHGKQSREYASAGCYYTRVTGIWQTVWLEYVPKARIQSVRLFPNVEDSSVSFQTDLQGSAELRIDVCYQGKCVGQYYSNSNGGILSGSIALSELHLWEVGNGRLYDLILTYGEDRVYSYFGMRSLLLDGMKFRLNGKAVFQRLVLDQGFYPDGIYTASSDEALENDIKISMAAGFNGARLHQKVFEPRFLYHCDRLGYMVWGEYGNWGMDYSNLDALPRMLQEWMEVLERDINHPSIVIWCPFNETWGFQGRKQDDLLLSTVYHATKHIDPTRPCIDASGGVHVVTDIFDVHDYTQDPAAYADMWTDADVRIGFDKMKKYHSEKTISRRGSYLSGPFLISEYGGIRWDVSPTNQHSWGYGNTPKTVEEFIERYRGLTDILLDNEGMLGFCYTQLYDVEQEVNGLYTYDRVPKFDMSIFHQINSRKAKIED